MAVKVPLVLGSDGRPRQLQSPDTISGAGDVVGPASVTDNTIVAFDGTTGKLIKTTGWKLSDVLAFAAAN